MEKQDQKNALPLGNYDQQNSLMVSPERDQKYRRIFEHSVDSLILWDIDHRIIDVNRAGEKMIGLKKKS